MGFARRRNRQGALIACFLLPSLAIFVLYRVVPLVWNVVLSFEAWSPTRPARFVGLANYQDLLRYDDVFWQALQNTLVFMAAAPIAIVLALGIALLVNADLRGAAVYRTIVFLSYPLMTVAVGIIWRSMYEKRGLLSNFDLALPAVLLADTWQMLGFYMIVLLTGLQAIPPHLDEAARIDGVPGYARLLRIKLPLLRPSLFLCAVIGLLNSFTAFDLVYIMTDGGPGHATELLVTYAYKLGFGQTRFDAAAAATVLQVSLLLMLTLLASWAAGGNAGAVERE